MEEKPRPARAVVAGLLVIALVAVVAILARGGEDYRLHVRISNASQLVKGNLVEVGGYSVGTVQNIELGDDNQADVTVKITDEKLTPLHRGTRAWVRSGSVSGVANRYIALAPGPNSEDELDSGATIPASATNPSVDLDAALSTFDGEARKELQSLIHGAADLYSEGGSEGLRRTLTYLDPALSQLDATLSEITRDRGALQKFIVASANVVSAVAERRDDVQAGIASAATTAGALARERDALQGVLAKAPTTLTHAGRSLRSLAGTLDTVTPVAREALPVAPKLRRLLVALSPTLDRGSQVLPGVRALLPSLEKALVGLPALRDRSLPAFAEASEAVEKYLPIVKGALPYVPDAVLGATNGFGGTAGGYYDANGSYARIAAMFGPQGFAGLLNGPPSVGPLTISYHNNRRCPGAATQVTRDGSNRFDGADPKCVESQRP